MNRSLLLTVLRVDCEETNYMRGKRQEQNLSKGGEGKYQASHRVFPLDAKRAGISWDGWKDRSARCS